MARMVWVLTSPIVYRSVMVILELYRRAEGLLAAGKEFIVQFVGSLPYLKP